MKPSINPIAAAAVAVLALAVPAHAQRDFDWSGAISPGATLRIFTVNGTVTVRQASGGTARVHGETEHAGGGDEIRYVSARSGNDVRVCALRDNATCDDDGVHSGRGSWRSRHARGNLTVEVPRGVVVRVSSGNGDVTVDGATADVHASSGNGDVRVGTGAGVVRASTGNGTVLVEGARGAVNASSGNGRVAISTASGPVSASTGNGRIEVDVASLRGAGDMTFSSGNGPVVLTLPADFSADIDASTGNGGFQSDFPLRVQGRMSSNRVSGTIGQGGRRLHISTGNGTITLRRAGS